MKPKRKAIPLRTRRVVVKRQDGKCICGSGLPVSAERDGTTDMDHTPALALREIAPNGRDWIPSQHDPDKIVARARACKCHKTKTYDAAGSDTRLINKLRPERVAKFVVHRGRKPHRKFRRTWPKRPMVQRPKVEWR